MTGQGVQALGGLSKDVALLWVGSSHLSDADMHLEINSLQRAGHPE